MKFIKLIPIIFLLFLKSCTDHSYTEGNYIFPSTLDSLKIGDSKQSILQAIGPPSIYSSFNENYWYYFYEKNNKILRFMNKQVEESKVIILQFNGNNLSKIDILTEQDRKHIKLDKNKTNKTLKKSKKNYQKEQEIDSLFNN